MPFREVKAAGLSCTSAQAGNWSDATTWTSCSNGVPGAADNATITHAVTLTSDIDITTGTLTVNSGGTLDTSATNYNINAAKLTIGTGGIVTANSSIISLSGTGTVFTKTGTFNYDTSTFKYTGGTIATNIASATYYNLYLDHASTTYTAAGNITVTNVFTVNSGTFSGSSRTITLSGTTGTPFVLTGAFTPSTSTISYTGDNPGGDTTITATTYNNLTINNSSENFTIDVSSIILNSNLTASAGTLIGTGTMYVNGTAGGNGYINLTGGTFTVKAAGNFGGTKGWTFYDLVLGDGIATTTTTKNGAGSITVANVLTIAANKTLNAGTVTWILSGATGTPFVNNGVLTAATSTISYTGENPAGNTTVLSTTYNNLIINNGSETYVAGGALILNNNLTITAGIFDPGYDINIAGSWSNAGTFVGGNNTVTFNGVTTMATSNNYVIYKTITSGGSAFGDLVFNNAAGGWKPLDTMPIEGDLSVTAGILLGNQSVTVNGGSVTGNGTINLVNGAFSVDGTGDFGGTTNWNFHNLTFGDGSGAATTTKISSNQITLTGVLTIAANQTLDAGSGTWVLTGSGTPFVKNGTFTKGTSTFKYAPYQTVTVTAADYYNLEILRSVVDMSNVWVPVYWNIKKFTNSGVIAGFYEIPAQPRGMAVDAEGNPWVCSRFSNILTKLSPSGVPIFAVDIGVIQSGLFGVAIDKSGNAWAENFQENTVTKMNGSTGEVMGIYSISSGSWGGIIVDASDNIWVTNSADATVTKMNNSGSIIGIYPVGTTPHSVAVDEDGNIWVANSDSDNVTKINGLTGATIGTYPVGDRPHSVFGDGSGNMWTVNTGSDDVTKLNASTGAVIGTYTVGDESIGGSVDSSGNIWVESANDDSVRKLNGSTGETMGIYSLNIPVGDWSYTFGDLTGFTLQHFTCGGSCGAGKTVVLSAGTFNVSNDFTIGDGTNPITVDASTNNPTINVVGDYSVLTNATIELSHTITASAGANGSIDPTGVVAVDYNANQDFTITANSGYHISDIKIDGVSQIGVLSSPYSFTNVTVDHTIAVSFAVSATHGSGDDDESETETPASNEVLTSETIIEEITQTLHNYNNSTPTASFTTSSDNITGLTTIFDASGSTSNKGIIKYEWDFGDGEKSNSVKINHKYNAPGRYTVTLVVTDQAGNKNTTTKTVDIKPIAPTITNITAKGTALWIEGKADPYTVIYFTIHSNPFEGQGLANKDGYWTYYLDNASEVLGESDHTIFALAAVKLSDNTELKGAESKTYDFKMSVDNGKLKVETQKTRTWQIVSITSILIIILLTALLVFKRKRAQRNY